MRIPALIACLAAASTTLAACPYAERMEKRDCPYAKRAVAESPAASQGIGKRATDVKLGVFYMNRIGPSGGQLYIANADGSNATALMGDQTAAFDYHPNWSLDGQWIVFTSERRADGQSDIYRIKPDGTGLETLVSTDAFEDSGVLSPDGTQLAYISTAFNYTANLFVLNLDTGVSTNLTGGPETAGNLASPHSFFRPTWSPDGQWIAFSSDINTAWTGHSDGTGWEHTQTLSIYLVRPNGSDFRQVVTDPGFSLGTPKFSADGTRIIYNNMTTESTYNAHGFANNQIEVASQIYSVDVATGLDVIAHTTDESTLKVGGQFIGDSTSSVGYLVKADSTTGTTGGIYYTAPDASHTNFTSSLRSPSWSPDGSKVVYEILNFGIRQANQELFSFDDEWEYRFMDVFPQLNAVTGRLATTSKNFGDASNSVVTSSANYTDLITAFDVHNINNTADSNLLYLEGLAGAFQPTWSPDGAQIAVGFGGWFFSRGAYPGTLYLADANNGSSFENLTDGSLNVGFPSFSPDGTKIVYRVWGFDSVPQGLQIMDLATRNVTQLTTGWDNTPGWSPDGELIVFTRQTNWTTSYGARWYADRYDIATIKPDGTDLNVVTQSDANDAHAVWSADGRILYSSGMYGFRDECALFDNTFQPYGQIVVMNADGSNKTLLTDTMWEDSMPQFIPNSFLE